MKAAPRRGTQLFAIAMISLAAVGAALWTQHALDMQPCPWCVLQRLIFVCIALVLRLAFVQMIAALLVLALGLSGAAAALWQHYVAAASPSCNMTLADRIVSGLGLDGALPEIFQARASCADAAVKLWGLPYEFWSLILFMLLSVMALRLLLRRAF